MWTIRNLVYTHISAAKTNLGRDEYIAERFSMRSNAAWWSLRMTMVWPNIDTELIGPGENIYQIAPVSYETMITYRRAPWTSTSESTPAVQVAADPAGFQLSASASGLEEVVQASSFEVALTLQNTKRPAPEGHCLTLVEALWQPSSTRSTDNKE